MGPLPGMQGNPQLALMLAQMAQNDPDGLAKTLAAKGVPIPEGMPGLPQVGGGGTSSLGGMMDPSMQGAGPPSPVTMQPLPPPGVQGPMPAPASYVPPVAQGSQAPLSTPVAQGAAAGGNKAAQLAQVLSSLQQPAAQPQPQMLSPPGVPSQGPINGNVNPQNLQLLINLLKSQPGAQKSLGSIMPGR